MLGKLMKYDMRYMARILPWLYLGGVAFAMMISLLIFIISDGTMLIIGFYAANEIFSLIIRGISVCSAVFMILRIYRNLFSDEGYLTFSLPVKNSDVLNGKILTGAIWTFFSYIVIGVMIALPVGAVLIRSTALFDSDTLVFFDSIIRALGTILSGNWIKLAVLAVIGIICLIAGAFVDPSLYSMCGALTHKIKRGRVFASVGIFLGIKFAISALVAVASFSVNMIWQLSTVDDYGDMITPVSYMPGLDGMLQTVSGLVGSYLNILIILLVCISVLYITITVISWVTADRIVNR